MQIVPLQGDHVSMVVILPPFLDDGLQVLTSDKPDKAGIIEIILGDCCQIWQSGTISMILGDCW